MDYEPDPNNPIQSAKAFFQEIKEKAQEQDNDEALDVAEDGLEAVEDDNSWMAMKKVKELKKIDSLEL